MFAILIIPVLVCFTAALRVNISQIFKFSVQVLLRSVEKTGYVSDKHQTEYSHLHFEKCPEAALLPAPELGSKLDSDDWSVDTPLSATVLSF